MDDEGQYGLVMPFVVVKSKGGPFDDASFVAGFEMGQLDVRLSWPGRPAEVVVTLREENRQQADLVAMRHGYRAELQHSEVVGWVFMRFTRQSTAPAGGAR